MFDVPGLKSLRVASGQPSMFEVHCLPLEISQVLAILALEID